MKKKILNSNYRYRGLETVEAALVFPLILVFTFVILGFGLIFFRAHQMTNAARAGVRVAILHGKTQSEVSGIITEAFKNTGITGYDDPIITGIDGSKGDPVKVTISIDLDKICPIPISPLTAILPGNNPVNMPPKIRVSATMAKEGP